MSPISTSASASPPQTITMKSSKETNTTDINSNSNSEFSDSATRYAAKVGRKATERILSKSKFFPERNVLIQNEEERIESLLDESNHSHSTANQILQLDPQSISLGRVLGKGG